MIVDEKGLCRAIKKAYKTTGYQVQAENGETMIWTVGWFVKMAKLPPKVLALVVEHMEALPGAATNLQHKLSPQIMIEAEAAAEVKAWTTGGCEDKLSFLPITVAGAQLLQGEAGELHGVDPVALEIVEAFDRIRTEGNLTEGAAVWLDADSMVAMTTKKPSEGSWIYDVWTALQGKKIVVTE